MKLVASLLLCACLFGQEGKPPAATVKELEAKIATQDAQIAQLKKQLSDTQARMIAFAKMQSACFELLVANEQQATEKAK